MNETAPASETRPSPQRVRGEVNRVVGDLVAYMRMRGFEAGERVGSERDFANRFGVGRGVVREALSALESMRVVERRPSSGIYLRPVASEGSIDAMVLFSDLGRIAHSCYLASRARRHRYFQAHEQCAASHLGHVASRDAMHARDTDRAVQAMDAHLVGMESYWLERIDDRIAASARDDP